MDRRIVLVALARPAAAACFRLLRVGRTCVLRVAAAADMKFAMDEVIEAFREKYLTVRVEVTYGSSGNFYAQLSKHAPFDIFFSADVDYPRRLIREGAAVAETEFLYGIGRLVVWVPRASSIDVEKLGMQSLLDASVKKIAIANPRHAPYGRAASKHESLPSANSNDEIWFDAERNIFLPPQQRRPAGTCWS
jgi:ABC-type molybdate transport system substrate-binding protein